MAIESRSTVKKVSFWGSPPASFFQDPPPFSLRQTAGDPPGQVRVIGSSGSTKTVSGSCGCTRMGKPKSEGSPLAMERQVRPWSSLRTTPMPGRSGKPPWFCK